MAKKQYRIEVSATEANVSALKAANIDFTLYEVNEVRKSSESFACRANFDTVEILLNPVDTIDTKDYAKHLLENHCVELQKTMPHKMKKIVKL